VSELLSPDKPAAPKTADDINDLFKELDTDVDEAREIKEPPTKEEKEIKEPKKDKDDDSDEEDEGLDLVEDEEDDEKLDLKSDDDIDVAAPPRKREILAKYPDIFKTFPFLEKMLYRDKRYSELFGSFDDAEEAAEQVQSFKEFEGQLLAGDTATILGEIKESDPKAFDKIVDNYLPTLYKVDKDAYFHVINGYTKRIIVEMATEGKKLQNDDLIAAAALINQFFFQSTEFTPHKPRTTQEKDSAKEEVEKERLDFVKERFETARDDMQTRVDNKLRATINEYIDPRGNMSSYVKKNAIADAMSNLQELMGDDASMVKSMDNLWRSSFESKFSKDSLTRIESFYLGRAKRLLKSAIIKARTEALKDATPSRKSREDDEEEAPRKRGIIPAGRPSRPKAETGMKKGESVAEFFSRD
jgi:hypothetical protein